MSFRKLLVDMAAMSSVNVVRLLAQFMVVPVLARFLSPTDYGLVGLAMPFLTLAMIFADAGLGMSLVHTSVSKQSVWSACFWVSAFLGVALATVLALLAPAAGLLFDEPRLGAMVSVLALVVVAQSLVTVPGALLQQSRRFRLAAGIEIAAVIGGVTTAVFMAADGMGAWALIGQQVAFFAVRLVCTWFCAPFRPLMAFDIRAAASHLIFGGQVLGANIVGFFSRSLDNLIIGKVLGTAAVGHYSMTFQFVRLPMMIITGPLLTVLYVHLVPFKDNKLALRDVYLFVTRVLAIVLFPVIGMVAAAHDAVFNLLLSKQWSESGTLFLLLAPACAVQAVAALNGTVRMALGRADIQLRAAIEFGVLWIAALMASVRFGLAWTAVAYNCAVLVYSPRSLALVLPLIDCRMTAYVSTLIAPAVTTLGCVAVLHALDRVLHPSGWTQLGLAAALAASGVVASALMQCYRLRAEVSAWRLSHTATL